MVISYTLPSFILENVQNLYLFFIGFHMSLIYIHFLSYYLVLVKEFIYCNLLDLYFVEHCTNLFILMYIPDLISTYHIYINLHDIVNSLHMFHY